MMACRTILSVTLSHYTVRYQPFNSRHFQTLLSIESDVKYKYELNTTLAAATTDSVAGNAAFEALQSCTS
jgi:hypothetical protein